MIDMQAKRRVGFLAELLKLKAVPRLGWLLRGVRDVESVAAHSYGVACTAMLLADQVRAGGLEIDVERVLRMALLHDVTEARTGDLPSTVKRYFDARTLRAADSRAAADIFEGLPESGSRYESLWHEYEARETLEARIVKAADKLDLLLQAREYERGGARGFDEFRENAHIDFQRLGLPKVAADAVEDLLAAI